MQDASPYRTPREHLHDHLNVVMARLQVYVARHGHRLVQSDGRLSDLYVSVEEVSHALRPEVGPRGPSVAEKHGWPSEVAALAAFEAAETTVATRLQATASAGGDVTLPIEELRSAFRLSETEVSLLVAASAPHLSVDLARLFTFAWADFAVKIPTVGFLLELVGDGAATALGPDGALIKRGLLELRETSRWGSPTPHRQCGVVPSDSIVDALDGLQRVIGEPLALHCAYLPPASAPKAESLVLPDPDVLMRLRRLVATMAGGRQTPRLALSGARGSGRRTLLRAVCGELEMGVLECDLGGLIAGGKLEHISALDREATLRRAVLLLRLDTIGDKDVGPLVRAIDRLDAPVVVTVSKTPAVLARGLQRLISIEVERLGSAEQRELWLRTLEASGNAPQLSEAELTSLVSRFDLTPSAIIRAVGAASLETGRTPRRSRGDVHMLIGAVRRQLEHVLGELAERLETTLDWSDAVLAPKVTEALDEILASGRNKSKVYDDWGFRRKLSYGRGLSCLFSGPPGTGKTMMAAILGRMMGVDVFRIDLSRVASKWVGETEKNLARLFDEAERAQVILLFDEADSLFSRRTSVQSANDRFANMEINFLLQRMESYDGMTILTTNFEESIDEAFKRRIRFHVPFPMPDSALRAKLWSSMFPEQVELAEDIDFETLAERFPIAGGAIKNAALRAAFLAAAAGGPVTMSHLERAAVAEAETLGLAVRARPATMSK